MLLASGSLSVTATAEAFEAPTPSGAAKLKWRPRGSAAQRSVDTEVQPAAAAMREPPAREPARSRRTSGERAAGRLPAPPASRARLRDTILQVSSDQPLVDPFDDPEASRADVAQQKPLSDPFAAPGAEPAPIPREGQPAPGAEPRGSEPPSLEETLPTPPGREEPGAENLPPQGLLEGLGTSGAMTCEEYQSECRRIGREMEARDIRQIVVGLVIEGVENEDFPCECPLYGAAYDGRHFSPLTFNWKATGVCHKPLYFEDAQLERYGHSWNPVLQPFMSGAHFFVSIPLLPYKMGVTPPNECIYSLGYYRPGSCAPYLIEPFPLSLRGALFEAIGVTGFTFWFWPP